MKFLGGIAARFGVNGKKRAELDRLVTIGTKLQAGEEIPAIAARVRQESGRDITPHDLFLAIERIYQQALQLARDLGDKATEGETLFNLGRLYQDPPRRTVISTEGKSWDEMGDDLVQALNRRQTVSLDQQRTALTFYHQALIIAQHEHMAVLEAGCLLNIAVAHKHLFEPENHRSFLARAAEKAREIRDIATRQQIEAAIRHENPSGT